MTLETDRKSSTRPLSPEELGKLSILLDNGAKNIGKLLLLTEEQLRPIGPDKMMFDFLEARCLLRKDVPSTPIGDISYRYGFELDSKQGVFQWQTDNNIGPHRLIAVTGCTGAGKSTVVEMLREEGAEILDADEYAAWVVEPGEEGLKRLVAEFGSSILLENGRLDRRKLSDIIFFGNFEKKKRVEELLHPLVRKHYCDTLLKKTETLPLEGQVIVWDVPLFFESDLLHVEIEKVIVVTAPREVCLERVMRRDDIDHDLAASRFDSQVSPQEKEKAADCVIRNSKDKAFIAAQIRNLYRELSEF